MADFVSTALSAAKYVAEMVIIGIMFGFVMSLFYHRIHGWITRSNYSAKKAVILTMWTVVVLVGGYGVVANYEMYSLALIGVGLVTYLIYNKKHPYKV